MLVALALATYMQAVPLPEQPAPAAPAARVQVATAPTMTPTQFGTLLYDGGGVAASKFANDGFDTLNSIWNLPDFLATSRLPENTVDQPDAAALNDTMIRLLPGLLLVGFVLVIGSNALSVMTGNLPNPVAVLGALSVVAVVALVAVNNRWFQHFPIDLVNLLLSTISGAPIRDFAGHGLHVVDSVSVVWAAIVAIVFLLLMLALTVVLFIEGVWCIVLGSLAAIWILGSALPFFGSGCQFMLRRWIGSLFSPVLVFAALKLMSAIVAEIPTGAPGIGLQLLMIAFGIVAWQAPGVMVGAVSVSFPGAAATYFAGRLIGAGRLAERLIPHGGGGNGASSGSGQSRQEPPHRVAGGFGSGSGSAASRKLVPTAA